MIEALQRALPELVLWGTALSVLSLVAVIVAVPWVVSRLPVDYFSSQHRHPLREQMGITAMIMALLKNLLGMVLVLLGLVMLFTPGQGLLMTLVGLSPALGTFLAGVVLADSSYRHELESDIEPFKGLLLGVFFIAVGASIDFSLITSHLPLSSQGATVCLFKIIMNIFI